MSFGPAPDYKIFVDGGARPRIDEAIQSYRDTRISALHSISRKEIMIPLSEVSDIHFKKMFATCNYYSVSLLELAEQMQQFLLVLGEMQVEIDERPSNRSWAGIWDSWWRDNNRRGRPRLSESELLKQ